MDHFLDYTSLLISEATHNEHVLGLILLGSTAELTRVDEWSDHDFFLVVTPGYGEIFRTNLDWLPKRAQAIATPRETQHGYKVLFDDGHIFEFAVFEPDELQVASISDYSVPVDKANIREQCVGIFKDPNERMIIDWQIEYELFLSLILIGVGRLRRGEALTANQFIRAFALEKLLRLIACELKPELGTESLGDPFTLFRRFEIQYPELGRRLNAFLDQDLESVARAFVDLVPQFHRLTKNEIDQMNVVKTKLGWT